MVQRSRNRKKQVKQPRAKRSSEAPKTEAQRLRQRRLHRYKKRRATLKHSQLQSAPVAGRDDDPRPTARKTVLGTSQKKRGVKRQKVRAAALSQSSSSRRLRRRKQNRSLNLVRFLLAGIGIAGIAGFALARLHPDPSPTAVTVSENALQFQDGVELSPQVEETAVPVVVNYEQPGKELRQLKQELRNLAEQQTDLSTGLFFLNPETKEYVTYRGAQPFPAASMIKLPILIAFFHAVDEGKVSLDERLVMRPELIVGEAGAMQYEEPGTDYSALTTADWMITISDNTATNMIIDRLGGAEVLNQLFEDWGLVHTRINQLLPDLEGTNTMSPKDLAVLMAQVSQGEILTAHSRDRALDILRNTVTKTLLPQGISESAMIAHKTGDIGMAVGDAGLIDMPNGQRYVATVVVKRPHNDSRAQDLIRRISKMTYQAFSDRPVPRPPSEPATQDLPGTNAVDSSLSRENRP